MSDGITTLLEPSTPDALATPEQKQLAEIAVRIRHRVGRMLIDIYETGKELIAAREIFGGRGNTKDCIEWAVNETGLKRTTLYAAVATAKAFQPFETTDSKIFFETIDVRILNQISSTHTPKPAREEFVMRVLNGETLAQEAVSEIIVKHRRAIADEADEKFIAQRNLIEPWGELKRLEDPEEEYPFFLVDRDGVAHWFRNYSDISKQYAQWKAQRLKSQFDQAVELLTPYWSIKLAPARKQPERVVVESQIPGVNKQFTIASPASLMRWWDQEGRVKTQRLLANNPRTIAATSTELLTKLDLEKAACRDCRWHDPEHEGNQYGVWCGFYKDTLSLDRIQEMPLRCNQYRHESNADPLPPARVELPVETSTLPIPQRPCTKVAVIPPGLRSDSRTQSSDFSEKQDSAAIPIQLELDYWLQQIEALPDETLQVLEEQLEQIAAAIARRKQQSS
ncbi:hypothetical protein [Leptolyngbya sp. NIES-2104]|uniref:hypothetical protein n=1 Tax=Leptolyngbya sp. NIES-2104 TaxID=1552121 RepID=UPI0006EC7F5A|nr:hypothetical protein [Leptolyngbya sp. NIES-2104]GAP99573.1 hypothetical protein NIES2104_61390 [Leptolyngbya sp. NIES-2104]